MGQIRRVSAATTYAVRAAIQRSQIEGPPAIGSRAGLRARATEQRTGYKPQNRRKMAQAGDGRGYEDGASGTAITCSE
jgi:hypothetical protein